MEQDSVGLLLLLGLLTVVVSLGAVWNRTVFCCGAQLAPSRSKLWWSINKWGERKDTQT
jgi:hypothetical protein